MTIFTRYLHKSYQNIINLQWVWLREIKFYKSRMEAWTFFMFKFYVCVWKLKAFLALELSFCSDREKETSKIKQRKMNLRFLYDGFLALKVDCSFYFQTMEKLRTKLNSIKESFVVQKDVNSILSIPQSFVFTFTNTNK